MIFKQSGIGTDGADRQARWGGSMGVVFTANRSRAD